MAEKSNFRVIIAGGSVVGLTLANALERAGIDYILLEKRDIAPDVGASISLMCHNSRVYEQLGVIDRFNEASVPFSERSHFNKDGFLFEDGDVFRGVGVKTQRPYRFLTRHFHLKTLYDNIRDKSKIHARTGVVSYEENDKGVTVLTDNGKRFEGSILVGADGVYSTIRQLMAEAAEATNPARAKNLKSPFTAGYRAIFAISNNINPSTKKPFMADGTVHVVYHKGVSGISATGVTGLVFWFLFTKEEKTTTTPNCPKYTEKDTEATIEQFGSLKFGSDYTFRDLYDSKVRAGMFPMEEGAVKGPWNNGGRVVLVGDCASKTTINPGLGGNTHVEGVVHLTNGLMRLLKQSPTPRTEEIVEMFNKYEKKQRPRAQRIVKLSHFMTRYESMETPWMKVAFKIMKRIPTSWISSLTAMHFAGGPLLEYPSKT
ncbi:FAD/NAD(P)-binding domain-containing protein [Xylaria nigripes]|nr:FAD/NAD(P)-binding domain-containing protein [Xylaria nigripes]